jgi:hypothetical protein
MRNTKNTTATMQSIQSQVTESMKQSFVECRETPTKDEILSHLASFSSRKTKKAWLTKRINDRVVYLNLFQQASTKGWKHFYGQAVHQKFVELSMATLQSMIEIRVKLSPESERETLIESFLRPFTNPQSKIVTKQAPKPQPKVVSQPKVVAKVEPKVKQPKVADQPKVDALTELTKSVTALATQMASLTEMVVANSKAIAELQQPKVVKEQPKVVSKPKVSKQLATAKEEPTVLKEQPKVVKKAKRQPKVASSQISIFDAIFKSSAPKPEKKSTISHEDAFEHRSDVEKSAWRKFRLEVK